MKFRFKIQQYQTDAVESVVRVFAGQPYARENSYRRDVGKEIFPKRKTEVKVNAADAEEFTYIDREDDTGFLNENLMLTDAQLLENVRAIQQENNIRLSDNTFIVFSISKPTLP